MAAALRMPAARRPILASSTFISHLSATTSHHPDPLVAELLRLLSAAPSWTPNLAGAISSSLSAAPASAPDAVIPVLRALKNPSLAAPFFLLASSASSPHPLPVDAYNAVFTFFSHDLAALDKVLEDMSVLWYGLSNPACADLETSFVRARRLDDVQHAIGVMRRLKFRPGVLGVHGADRRAGGGAAAGARAGAAAADAGDRVRGGRATVHDAGAGAGP